jgi:prepilin-type processing-associated H-X9-DG protein/prepilin-type N-terminal cleavage/methylation domain-containing protein
LKKKSLSNKGLTLVELLVVIAIIIVMAAVVVPVGKGMYARSRAINCSQNLRQIGVATMMYAGDNNMTLPVCSHQRRQGGVSWTLTLQPYASGKIVFKCNEDANKNRAYTYILNDFLTPNPSGAPDLNCSILANIRRPETTFMFAEAKPTYNNLDHFHFSDYDGGLIPDSAFKSQIALEVHSQKSNFLFADGHVETLAWREVRARNRAIGSSFVNPR